MSKFSKSKGIATFVITCFLVFTSQYLFAAQANANTGNVVGFIYEQDGTTPVEGAILQARNINTGKVYKSTKTDKLGMFKAELEQGMYVAGVSTKEGDYNLPNLIGIKANETAKVSLALKPEPPAAAAGTAGLAAFFMSPLGIIVLIAAVGLLTFAFVKLTEKEEEASPFKK